MSLLVQVDTQERKVFPFLKKLTVPYTVTRLAKGDYAIYKNGKLYAVIERKTWKDLASTISKRGKYSRKKNFGILIDVCNKYNIACMYLIEGKKPSHAIRGVTVEGMCTHIKHMIQRRIHCEYTKSKEETVKFINDYALSLLSFKDEDLGITSVPDDVLGGDKSDDTSDSDSDEEVVPTPTAEPVVHVPIELKKNEQKPMEDVKLLMWASLPGISDASAAVLASKYTFADFLQQKVDMKESIRYNNGRAFAKKTMDVLSHLANRTPESSGLYEKIFASIPGMSKESAGLLIAAGVDPLDASAVADVQRPSGRRLGEKLAEKIVACLT